MLTKLVRTNLYIISFERFNYFCPISPSRASDLFPKLPSHPSLHQFPITNTKNYELLLSVCIAGPA